MSESLIGAVVFYGLAALTVGGAVVVAFSRNIVRSAFSLLATLVGAAGLYGFLSAELMVVVQVMVYVGGVLVVILFAVMLTSKISDVKVSNPSMGVGAGLLILVAVAGGVGFVAHGLFAGTPSTEEPVTVAAIGEALVGRYLLPFEVAAVVLLAVLIGAVSIARGHRRDGKARRAEPEESGERKAEESEGRRAEGEAA